MAITGCGVCCGLSWIVRSFSVVCPWNVGVISSVGLSVSSVSVSYGWYSVASPLPLLWMFFMLRRESSRNRWGRVVSSSVLGGKLYLGVACVYCGC